MFTAAERLFKNTPIIFKVLIWCSSLAILVNFLIYMGSMKPAFHWNIEITVHDKKGKLISYKNNIFVEMYYFKILNKYVFFTTIFFKLRHRLRPKFTKRRLWKGTNYHKWSQKGIWPSYCWRRVIWFSYCWASKLEERALIISNRQKKSHRRKLFWLCRWKGNSGE